MNFTVYPAKSWEEILPGLGEAGGRDLVSKLVVYESSQRLSAEDVCSIIAKPQTYPMIARGI